MSIFLDQRDVSDNKDLFFISPLSQHSWVIVIYYAQVLRGYLASIHIMFLPLHDFHAREVFGTSGNGIVYSQKERYCAAYCMCSG